MLVWFKRARARFMLVGVIIMGAVYLLARHFGLYLTTAVLQGFFAIFLVLIIVIFQDDLRYFFERIATWGIMPKRRTAQALGKDVEMITSAIVSLCHKKIGALVVIKGRNNLDRHIEAGVPINGLISQQLLEAVFDPFAPSHDGAMIIDGERIAKFGCHLPLSTNIREVGRLGTRHAAALGLAERSDALCIVVSEEEQTISAAQGSSIRIIAIEQLGFVIERFLLERFPRRKKSFLIDFVAGHLLEKIIAIILAFNIWFIFGYRMETVRRDFVVPVEYRNLDSDRIIKEPKVKEVTVTLSGLERVFNFINPKELTLSLDMSLVSNGKNEIILTKEMLRVPGDFSVVHIEPETILLFADRLAAVVVPIQPKTKGAPPGNFIIREIRVDPKEAAVIASTSIAKDKITLQTEEIDLSALTANAIFTPGLILAPEARFIQEKPPEVKVFVTLQEREKEARKRRR